MPVYNNHIGRVIGVSLLSLLWQTLVDAQNAPTQAEAIFVERFEQGDGGWTVVGDAQNETSEPTHQAAGGNPGGYIEARDDEAGGVWKWNAPTSFCAALQKSWLGRGDRIQALTYDLRQSDIRGSFRSDDIVLSGGGYRLGFVAASAPGIKWTSYQVPLDAALWRNIGTQEVATETEMAAVMGALTSLTIRGEYRTGADTGGFDNVGWGWQPAPPKPPIPEGETLTLRSEWRSALALNVKLLLTAMGEQGAANRITTEMWGPVKRNVLSNRDRLRFTLEPGSPSDPKHPLTLEVRYPGQPFKSVATGRVGTPIEIGLPVQSGPFEVGIMVQPQGKPVFRTPTQQFTVEPCACCDFYNHVLILMADAIFQYRQTEATKTYDEAWAAGEKPADPLLMRVDATARVPYRIESGDVVLRSGGRTSSVMGSLGSPDSPQTHAGIAVVKFLGGQRVIVVRQVVTSGYEEVPLSVNDAVILQKANKLEVRPVSFVEGANVASIEIYRPTGTIVETGRPYAALGSEVAANAERIGGTVTGYDFAFMERGSSTLAGEEPFDGLYYCNEFVRDAFGVSLAAADEKKVLKDFWQAAFRCDAESGGERSRMSSPSSLISALEAIPWADFTFNEADRNADAEVHAAIQEVIKTLKTLSRGTTIRQLLTEKVRGSVTEQLRQLSPAPVGPGAYDLALIMVSPETRAWMVMAEGQLTHGIATHLVDEMANDLGNAVGTGQLLAGGRVKNAKGQDMDVAFVRINQ